MDQQQSAYRPNEVHPRLWISWEHQRRSIELAAYFRCEYLECNHRGVTRYFKSIADSVKAVVRIKPEVLFVQNPSMVLALLAVCFGRLTGTTVVVDRHTTFRLNRKNSLSVDYVAYLVMNRLTLSWASVTIVTNEYLAQLVRKARGFPFVLPDKVPEIGLPSTQLAEGWISQTHRTRPSFLVIGSFAEDEPIEQVINAVKRFGSDRPKVFVSGRVAKAKREVLELGRDIVEFTDYLADQEFYALLRAVDAAIVLTTSDHTMLCGCYEAVAAEKMLITSDKTVLLEYFQGAVFVSNDPDSIFEAMNVTVEECRKHSRKVGELKSQLEQSWTKRASELNELLDRTSRSAEV